VMHDKSRVVGVGRTCGPTSTTRCTTTAELESRVRFAWTMLCRGLLSAATERGGDSDPRFGTLEESLREVDPGHQYPRSKIHSLGLVRCLGQRWNPLDLKDHPCGETDACGADLVAKCYAVGHLPMGLKGRSDRRTSPLSPVFLCGVAVDSSVNNIRVRMGNRKRGRPCPETQEFYQRRSAMRE
jgi:hypothetical protein